MDVIKVIRVLRDLYGFVSGTGSSAQDVRNVRLALSDGIVTREEHDYLLRIIE